MADWIAGFKPDTVVMESTGIYWKSPYAALEKVGIRALVVNAQHVKKVPGRKTDISDAEWLAMLARAGLLRGSFIPPESLRNLRQLSRYHNRTTARLAAEKNRLVRVLSDAGIRLTAVVSDAHGVAARAMIDCLLNGGTPEQALAHAGRLQAPREELLAALQGELSEHHWFVARMIRQHLDILETQLADLERQWFDALKPYEAALEWLLTIPGIDRLAAAKLVVEIGLDRTAFGNAGRLAKWAGVCPGNHESAGQRGPAEPSRVTAMSAPSSVRSRGPPSELPVNLRAAIRPWSFVGGPRRRLSPLLIKCSKRCSWYCRGCSLSRCHRRLRSSPGPT